MFLLASQQQINKCLFSLHAAGTNLLTALSLTIAKKKSSREDDEEGLKEETMTDKSIVVQTSTGQPAVSVGANQNLDYYLEGPRYKKDLLVQIHDYPTRFNYLTPIEDVLKGTYHLIIL